MRVLIATGGTGGHIYPALAIASYLKEHHLVERILWVGGERKLESELLHSQKFEFKKIKAQSLPRALSPKWIIFVAGLLVSFLQSFFIFLQFRPTIVIGIGSFHSYPVVMLAFFLGTPSLICEQNVRLSLTNRLLSPYVSRVAISFLETNRYLPKRLKDKTHLVGNPVRSEVLTATRKEGMKKLNLDEEKFILLFFGGSQGAHNLNKLGIEVIRLLDKERIGNDIQIIFITGKRDIRWVKESLGLFKVKSLVFSYLQEIEYAYAVSNLIVCRSGATTIAEVTARGLPAILVPYPYATGGHQYENAKALEAKGAARLLIEENLTSETLKKLILDLIKDRNLLEKMGRQSKRLGRPQATREVARLICELAREEDYVKRS